MEKDTKKSAILTYNDFSLGTDKSPELFLRVAPATISAIIFTYNPLFIWPLVLKDPCLKKAISSIPVPIDIGKHFTIEKYLSTFSSIIGTHSLEDFKGMPSGITNFMQVDGIYNLHINEPIESLIHLILSVDVPLNVLEILLSICWQPRSLVVNSQRTVGVCKDCMNRKQKYISPFGKCKCDEKFQHNVSRVKQIFNLYALLSTLGVDVIDGIQLYQGNFGKHESDDEYLHMMFSWEDYESITKEKIKRMIESKSFPSREATIFIMDGVGFSLECEVEALNPEFQTLLHRMMKMYVSERGKIILNPLGDQYRFLKDHLPEFFREYFVMEKRDLFRE